MEKPSRRIPRRTLEGTRTLVLSAIDKGMRVDEAATVFGVGRSTIFGWLKLRKESGPAALVVKKAPGREPQLTERQMAQLRGWIIGNDPRQLQFEFGLWTREMVGELIKRKFGVVFTSQWVGTLLHRLDLSPQRPLVRAYEKNPERVRQWKEEEYPKIRAMAITAGASVFFADEAGVRTDYHSGTTWAPVGNTPIVIGTGSRVSANMFSAVNTQGKLYFSFFEGNLNAEVFIECLKKLLDDIPGKIFLIIDGAPAHRSNAAKEFAKSTKGRLKLFFLPPYSPELNPDEWVWKNIKHDHVGRMAARTKDELKKGIEKAVARMRNLPEIVRGFFADRGLRYMTT
ncbi:IS630 family transposase [Streptosporangium sp. NBC_01810]|uniref:IS630 family transposase n=1 Tax=Streptosporangium sp. NBC_01810 TaxID=2975951 RepID=UPI002DD7F0D0|nr:IS630 family transposase [Streptosporangium sp. NBC_01810]WSA27983.1 IS630 family transposase [Streptosporangium sp. NBC_01810]